MLDRRILVLLLALDVSASRAVSWTRAPAALGGMRPCARAPLRPGRFAARLAIDASAVRDASDGGGGGGARGSGNGGGRWRDDGDADDDEYAQLPLGWPLVVPLLHALNKGLICWSIAPELRDLSVRLTDTGFLGALGALAAFASFRGADRSLAGLRWTIVQIGLGHMVLESLVNGVLLPRFRSPETGAHSPSLRAEMWAHHCLAIVAFSCVLVSRTFVAQAVLLTATECTVALPPALQEARRARRAHGVLSSTLGALLLVGFTARCALSAAVVLPTAARALGGVASALAGKSARPALAYCQGTIWACALGLGSLNVWWLNKVVQGAIKLREPARARVAVTG